MKRLFAVISLAALTACGADGEPIKPSMSTNVGVGTNGVSASTGVRVGKGPFSVGWGLGL